MGAARLVNTFRGPTRHGKEIGANVKERERLTYTKTLIWKGPVEKREKFYRTLNFKKSSKMCTKKYKKYIKRESSLPQITVGRGRPPEVTV